MTVNYCVGVYSLALVAACMSGVAVAVISDHRQSQQSASSTTMPSFYHTSANVSTILRNMQSKCPSMTVESMQDPEASSLTDGTAAASLDVVRIKSDGGSTAKLRVALVFGEHARELISTELALHLVKGLCSGHGSTFPGSLMRAAGSRAELGDLSDLFKSNVSAALDNAEFLIIPNANPVSRVKVEQGNFCLRANEGGVDLNRDWNEHWTGTAAVADAPPGKKPFSQPESRIVRKALMDFVPSMFVSIHSGSLGIFVPWAYSKTSPKPARASLALAEGIDRDFCKCPFGAAAATVGYACPGTSLDYVYDKMKVQNSYAVEIWINEDLQGSFRSRWLAEEKRWNSPKSDSGMQLAIAANSQIESDSLLELGRARHTSKAKHMTYSELKTTPAWCFKNFNPVVEAQYNDVITRWKHALLALTLRVQANRTAALSAR